MKTHTIQECENGWWVTTKQTGYVDRLNVFRRIDYVALQCFLFNLHPATAAVKASAVAAEAKRKARK